MTVSKGDLARKAVYASARAGQASPDGVSGAGALAAIESAAEVRLGYLTAAETPGPASVLRDGLASRNAWRPAAPGVRLRAPQHAQLGSEYLLVEPLGEVTGDPALVRWFWRGAPQGVSQAFGPFDGCWVDGHAFLGIGNEVENPCGGGGGGGGGGGP